MNKQEEASEEEPFLVRIKNRRFQLKIELLPAFLNLPFVGIIISLLFANREHWALLNSTLTNALGIELNWIYILIGIVVTVGLLNLTVMAVGVIRLRFAYVGKKRPYLLILPAATLTLIFIGLIVLTQVEERVDLAYLFTQMGSAAFGVFLAITIAVYFIIAVSLYFIIKMWRSELNLKRRHPKHGAILTLYSLIIVGSLLLWMATFYSTVDSFWLSYSELLQYFLPWNKVGPIVWITAVGLTISYHFIERKSRLDVTERQRKAIYISLISIHIASLALTAVNISGLFSETTPMIWPFSIILFAAGSALSFVPNYADLYRNKIRPQILSVDRPLVAKICFISAILLVPFAYYYWLPLAISIPSVDLPFQERMVSINGVDVPFQGGIVYPSFETQNTTDLEVSGGARYSLNLSGEWKWKHTSESYPDYNLLMRTPAIMDLFTRDGIHMANYDDSGWGNINIPRPNCFPYWEGTPDDSRYGTFWYRRAFDVPSVMADHQLILKFYGGGYLMDVWINGSYVGYHEITQNGFVFDVTDNIEPGKQHVIAIRVVDTNFGVESDSAFRTKRIPPSGDNFVYGGLTREIWLEALPVASIIRTDVKMIDYETEDHQTGNATVQANVVISCPQNHALSGSTADLRLTMYPLVFQNSWVFDNNTHFDEIYSENLTSFRNTWEFANFSENVMTPLHEQITLTGDSLTNYTVHQFTFDLVDIDLWSTKKPSLYAVFVNLTTSEYEDSFCTQTGFRHFTTQGKKFMLNGAEVKLPGVAFHEEMWDPYGSSVRDWQMIYKLMRIKAVNANFIRMGQYPMHPNWYLFGERMGFAMWAEEPLTWLNEIHFTTMLSRDAVDPLLIQLMYPNINRPGILFWGGPNEPWAGDDFKKVVDLSNEFVMQYDGTRLYSFAAVLIPQYYTSWKTNDDLDVLSPNNYAGTHSGERGEWYEEVHKSMDEFEAELGSENYDRPVIIMEYGYWHETWKAEEEWYENQVKCLNESVTAYLEMGVTSFTWFTVFDYIGFRSPDGWYSSGFGVYSLDGWTRFDPVANEMRDIYGNITETNL